jgi:hypothetical protein
LRLLEQLIGGVIGLISAGIWEAIKNALVGVKPPAPPATVEQKLKKGLIDTILGGGTLYATHFTGWGKRRTLMDKGFLYVFGFVVLIAGLVDLYGAATAETLGETLRKELMVPS